MVNVLYHRSFAVIPRGNGDALDQSHLRNFSAYIINSFKTFPFGIVPDIAEKDIDLASTQTNIVLAISGVLNICNGELIVSK